MIILVMFESSYRHTFLEQNFLPVDRPALRKIIVLDCDAPRGIWRGKNMLRNEGPRLINLATVNELISLLPTLGEHSVATFRLVSVHLF